jgi:hypothetical protein
LNILHKIGELVQKRFHDDGLVRHACNVGVYICAYLYACMNYCLYNFKCISLEIHLNNLSHGRSLSSAMLM